MKSRQLFTRLFWLDAIERVVATVGEFLLVLGGSDGAGWINISVTQLLTLSVLGGAASLLKAVVAAAKADTDTASLTVDTKELQ
jgi:hypothetical protein